MDVKVHVLRDGKQGDIINQYVTFTRIVNKQVELYGRTSQAAQETIRICMDRNVLAGYLAEHEQEVQTVMMTLFDNDQIMKAYTKEKVEEGRREGESHKAAEVAQNMLRRSFPMETIAQISGLSSDEVNALAAQTLT